MPTRLRRSSLASAPRRRHPTAPILHLAISNNPEHVDEMTTAGWQPTPLRAVSGGTAQPVQVLLQIDGHRDQAANSMSCCKCSAWKPTLLRAASAVASSGRPMLRKQAGVTPSRVRSCSASRPALLRAKSGVAPSRGRRCYKGQPTLLQRPSDLATMARRRCCKRGEVMLLEVRVATLAPCYATMSCRRCYKHRLTLLQRETVLATRCDQPCYHGAAALLQTTAGFATRGGRRRYLGVAALLPMVRRRCCKQRRCYRRGAVVLQVPTTLMLGWTVR